MAEEADLIEKKIENHKGFTKIELQCWVRLDGENMATNTHRRKVSEFAKHVKNLLYEQRKKNGDNYEYFVDVDIRDSPSTSAFLSLNINLIKNNTIIKLKEYPQILERAITDYDYFTVFKNAKKKKRGE